ncbi:E2F transcription factor-like E2FE [Aristolochia californica]|uniref:E2F transcription factor-like E2FE n=1 Tax=Aristolochia californica TaxID=171875 RepID=UPI0035DD26BF
MSSSSYLDPASRHHAYSRKQKSLGLLCCNFLNLYNRDDVELVGLDEAVLVRKAKNRYSWKRFDGIPKALQELKGNTLFLFLLILFTTNAAYMVARKFLQLYEGSFLMGHDVLFSVCVSDEDDKPSIQRIGENVQEQGSSKDCQPSSIQRIGENVQEKEKGMTLLETFVGRKPDDNRREKSLGLLTQNFVKLFLCTNSILQKFRADMVSLDDAARLLLRDAPKSAQVRTKVRRSYDIANVLSSMNLIEKPAFRWLGLIGKPDSDSVPCDKTLDVRQAFSNFKRVFGTDITNIDFKRTKVFYPIDEKTIKVPINCEASGQHDPI